jgi:hypothetical protein
MNYEKPYIAPYGKFPERVWKRAVSKHDFQVFVWRMTLSFLATLISVPYWELSATYALLLIPRLGIIAGINRKCSDDILLSYFFRPSQGVGKSKGLAWTCEGLAKYLPTTC